LDRYFYPPSVNYAFYFIAIIIIIIIIIIISIYFTKMTMVVDAWQTGKKLNI